MFVVGLKVSQIGFMFLNKFLKTPKHISTIFVQVSEETAMNKTLKCHLTAYSATKAFLLTHMKLCFLGFQPTSGVWSCP